MATSPGPGPSSRSIAEDPSPSLATSTGVVELREDVPLKAGAGSGAGGGAWGEGAKRCAGPRFIVGCFGALSAAVTVALLTQIYYGDYELVPHGSVASDAGQCSRAGTDALKAGGGAVDAAVAAALCLAVLAPHNTGLDASGSMLMWEYRKWRTQRPLVAEWGVGGEPRPRLVAALAGLHARYGRLPWPALLQPAIHLARSGFEVSAGLAAAAAAAAAAAGAGPLGQLKAGETLRRPALADYLLSLQLNSSRELAAALGNESSWSLSPVEGAPLRGGWRLYAGGRGAGAVAGALADLLQQPPPPQPPGAGEDLYRALDVMRRRQAGGAAGAGRARGAWVAEAAGATGLAVVDRRDVYLSLVTGMSSELASRRLTAGGWLQDDVDATHHLPPPALVSAVLVQDHVCGRRYVVGAGSAAALLQVSAALVVADAAAGALPAVAVERPRAHLSAAGDLELEDTVGGAARLRLGGLGAAGNATRPYASVNVVQQLEDQLSSHADSRAQGVASRF